MRRDHVELNALVEHAGLDTSLVENLHRGGIEDLDLSSLLFLYQIGILCPVLGGVDTLALLKMLSAQLCQEYFRVDLDYALDLLEVITLEQALLSRDAVTEDLSS